MLGLSTLTEWLSEPVTPTVSFSEPAVLPSSTTGVQPTSSSPSSASLGRATAVAIDVALQIPAMRRARAVLLTPSTFALGAWKDNAKLPAADPSSVFLSQPHPTKPLQWLLAKTIDDGLWYDRCVWAVEWDLGSRPKFGQRVHPHRYQCVTEPNDPDTIASWTVDGKLYSPDEFRAAGFVDFDFAGLGGLRRLGQPLLSLYADLQAAAGNYARVPHPAAILKNHGADLRDDEIEALLDSWEWARAERSVGYLNDQMDYNEQQGWSAQELQLTEGREHSALEVARLVGLPAFAVDAKSGDSMTYGNTVDRRRDIAESLRPWMGVITSTLSANDRTAAGQSRTRGMVLPRSVTAAFDVDAYVRDDPATRMTTWATAKSNGILTLDEIRRHEPLAESTDAP